MTTKKIINLVGTIFVSLVVVLAFSLIILRLSGFTSFSVLSASMTPKYKVGDLVYVKPMQFDEIEVGDVIVYSTSKNDIRVMHRVVEKISVSKNFYTKGDANKTKDANPVSYENVIGVVDFSIPKLGLVGMYFATSRGKIAGIMFAILLVLFFIIPDLFKKEENDEKN